MHVPDCISNSGFVLILTAANILLTENGDVKVLFQLLVVIQWILLGAGE